MGANNDHGIGSCRGNRSDFMKVLLEVLIALWNLLFKKPVNIIPQLPTDPITGALDFAAAAAQAVAEGLAMEQYLNTPAMVASVTAQNRQDAVDAFNKALDQKNLKAVQEGMSGAEN